MIKKIYIAGPLFNKHEQMYLEDIAKELEGNGYDCFLPHRDQPPEVKKSDLKGTDMSQEIKDLIFRIL
jgi:nucleoside 2-deoxyribosyltransferase